MPAASTRHTMYGKMHANGARSPDLNRIDPDLPLSILKHLPTPVLVLDQYKKALWTNRKAGALLGSRDSLENDESEVIGKSLDELGVKLLDDRSWVLVLNHLELLRVGDTSNDGNLDLLGGLEVVVNIMRGNQLRNFRVCIETLNGDHGLHFILTFESLACTKATTLDSESTSVPNDQEKPTLRMRHQLFKSLQQAVFDSVDTAAFILTADEGFCLPNRKTRDLFGDIMGGENGCDQTILREALEMWDETYTRRLPYEEYPGAVLVRTQRPFNKLRCGFVHPFSGDRMTTVITGECLYDDDGNFIGGICWCDNIQEFGEYVLEKQQNQLQSHETICDLMPHLVWTTTPDGYFDWYSKRVSMDHNSQELFTFKLN